MKTYKIRLNQESLNSLYKFGINEINIEFDFKEASNIKNLLPKIIYSILLIVPIGSCSPGLIFKNEKKDKIAISLNNIKDNRKDMIRRDSTIKVFLTFDDGPNKGTSNIMQLLDSLSVPATFFMVGSHIFGSKKQSKIFDSIIKDTNFIIANHTFNHAHNRYSKFYKDPSLVLQDFQLMKSSVKLENNFARTPGRNMWRTANICCQESKNLIKVSNTLKANDFNLIGWDLEWKTKGNKLTKTPDFFLCEMKKSISKRWTKTENNIVILLHDQDFENTNNINYLKSMVQSIKESKNIEFCKINEYPGLN